MAKEVKLPVLYIVVPCYNEEKVLPITNELFTNKLAELVDKKKIDKNSRVVFVNDGSKDETWNIIKNLSKANRFIEGISLSRNRGHQNALLGGLMEVKDMCDFTISIDCDGQDDIDAMNEMVDRYLEGYDVVYGVRSKRDTDSFFKRFTAESFYKVLNMMGSEVVYNHADYRLLSSRVLHELAGYEEVNLYLRGMVPLIGFRSCSVYYERYERMAGESHYPLTKMLSLAADGITSMSIKPIRIITGVGIIFSALSFIYLLFTLFSVSSYKSLFILGGVLCLLVSIMILSLGVVGEYVGKTYMESKHRPRYIISERTYKKK